MNQNLNSRTGLAVTRERGESEIASVDSVTVLTYSTQRVHTGHSSDDQYYYSPSESSLLNQRRGRDARNKDMKMKGQIHEREGKACES